jgi:hypothetical protein
MKKFNGYWISSYKSKGEIMVKVGFGLIGYVPNTLYNMHNIPKKIFRISIALISISN